MTKDSSSTDTLLEKFRQKASMGMKESALKLINDAVELNPDSALLHFNRGLLLERSDTIMQQDKPKK